MKQPKYRIGDIVVVERQGESHLHYEFQMKVKMAFRHDKDAEWEYQLLDAYDNEPMYRRESELS